MPKAHSNIPLGSGTAVSGVPLPTCRCQARKSSPSESPSLSASLEGVHAEVALPLVEIVAVDVAVLVEVGARENFDVGRGVEPKERAGPGAQRRHARHPRSIAYRFIEIDSVDVDRKRTVSRADQLDIPITWLGVANAEEPRFGGAAVKAVLAEIVNRQSGLRIDPNLATIRRCQQHVDRRVHADDHGESGRRR